MAVFALESLRCLLLALADLASLDHDVVAVALAAQLDLPGLDDPAGQKAVCALVDGGSRLGGFARAVRLGRGLRRRRLPGGFTTLSGRGRSRLRSRPVRLGRLGFQRGSGLVEPLLGLGGDDRELRIDLGQSIDYHRGGGDARIPLVVGRDDIPGRVRRTRMAQHL